MPKNDSSLPGADFVSGSANPITQVVSSRHISLRTCSVTGIWTVSLEKSKHRSGDGLTFRHQFYEIMSHKRVRGRLDNLLDQSEANAGTKIEPIGKMNWEPNLGIVHDGDVK
ncbi:unnamed protein product [Hymenolepis diminuta]|uniref:Uncharacterized protein n=1 Tax=Hymenolepis diminuta TaxID=6216 RepID=A0A564YM39_HYMDI|nr:unnamed protein product [Hymenolepis diminuta]